MTALFADLVGSTAFAERLDAEAVRAGLMPYFELLQSTIDDHAGSVVKFLGDGVFALFGVPEVAEDDALRAVSAGIDLQRRFRSFADEIGGRHGVDLGLRIGVNTGELVVGADDVDLVGDVLNTAARLEAACEPGRVLVGEDTWRLTRSRVSYEVLGEVRVKGKAEPIATFRVVDERVRGADEATPFVGRSRELGVLREVFDDAVRDSAARLATVIGDPGVGKTRLAHELRGSSEARSFDLRLERRGSTTFAPIADLLREVTGSGSIDGVERLVDSHPEANRLGPVLASFLGHGEPRTTEESFWAVRRLLEMVAADGPVIVVVDDIQWAAPLFWDLLDHLVEWTAAPVLLIALARPELRELRPELAQPGRRVSASIALEGLDAGTTLELAARLLDIDVIPAELAERLPRSTDGNPLFVRELVQMLVDDGVLARDGDRWHLTIDADAIEVPPTILSLLASRVERLPDDERQVIELASVIGTEFDRGTLAAIATSDTGRRLGAIIDRLRRKDLFEPTGQWAGDHPVYRFHHVLIRDAAYRRLLKADRAALHERAGRHVDASGIAEDERDVIVAHHFEQVSRYRTELGAVDGRTRALAGEAATRLRSTAERALGREDLTSAGSAAIRALQLLDTDAGTERDELLLIGCEALLSSADVARGGPLVDELHTGSADGRLAAWADCFRAQLWSLTAADRLTEAGDLAADAAARLDGLGDHSGVAKARLVRAGCLARLGRVGDCETELDLALGAARAAGDRRRTVAVLGAAPLAALWGPSPIARAGGRCLDVLRLLRITTASPTVESTSIRCQGMLEALRGRDDAARAKFETSRAIARELGLRHALYETELFAGLAELLAGDPAAAEPHLRAARDGLGGLGIGADAGQAAALLARSLLLQGRDAEADELATAALDTAGQNLQTAIAARAILAEVRATQGNHDAARVLVDEALAIVANTDVTLDHALTLLAAGRVAAAAGDVAASSRRTTEAAGLLAAKGVTNSLHVLQPAIPARGEVTSSDRDGREPHGRRVRNRVLEIAQRSAEFALAGDRASFTACYSPDLTLADHGELAEAMAGSGPPPAGASWFADIVLWMLSTSPDRVATIEPLAIRGEHHALYRVRIGSDAGLMDRLVVVSGNDQVVADVQLYDPDQLVEAFDELDRQWTQHDPSAVPYSTLAAGTRIMAAMVAGDPAALRSLLTPDFLAVDHRQAGLGERHLDEWIASNDMSATGHPFLVMTTEILDGDDRRCLARLAASAGDDTWHTVSLMELRDGLGSRFEHFDGNDVETATARFHELTRSDGPDRRFTNTACELSRLGQQAFARRDVDALRSLLATGFRAVWHERLGDGPLEADRDTFIDVLFDVDGNNDDAIEHRDRLLATRGDHLALTWNRIDVAGAERYVRYRVNESRGRQLIDLEWFDEDRLDDAIAELDRRWLSTCGVPSDSVVVRAWPMTRSTRAGDIADLAHPEFEYTDHCRLRTEPHGGDLAEFVRRGWIEPETWTLVTNVHRFDESGAVYERVEYHEDDEIPLVWVAQQADGAMRRLDRFDHDDLDAALALFDSRRPVADTIQRPLTNTAWEVSRRADDADGTALIIDGTTELLAVRGDHLALTRNSSDHDGTARVRYAVIESDDRHVISVDWFDDAQLTAALEALDRRYLLSQGFPADHWIVTAWPRTYGTTAEEMLPVLHPDVEFVEHRRLLQLSGGGEELLRSADAQFGGTAMVTKVVRITERGALYERVETEPEAPGELRTTVVLAFANDLVRHAEIFEADAFDDALARYDELTAGTTDSRECANTSSRLAIALTDAQDEQHADRMAALLSPDFTIRAHGRWAEWFPQVSGPEFVTAIGTEVGQGARVIDVVAVRGEHLSLLRRTHQLVSGLETDVRLFVVATDDERIISIDWYQDGQDAEAFAELDRRFLVGEGFPADHPLTLAWPGLYGSGSAALAPYLHPDLEYIDHRPFIEHRGNVEFLLRNADASQRSIVTVPQVFRVTDHSAVLERVEVEPGEPGEVRTIIVLAFADDLVRHLELFDPGGLDAALMRHAELTSAPRTPGAVRPNRAFLIADELARATVRRDRDAMLALLDDGFSSVARSAFRVALGTSTPLTRLETVDDLLVTYREGNVAWRARSIVATRGDRLYLSTSTLVSVGGDELVIAVVGESDDARLLSLTYYDESQLADACSDLDRRYRLACGIDDDHWITRYWHTLTSFDADRYDEILAPDFQAFDHRAITLGLTRRGEFLAWVRATPPSSTWSIPAIHRLDDRAMVYEHAEVWADGAGESRMLAVVEFGDGLTTRIDNYDVDDLDAALARYEEITDASRRRLTNDAWESARRRQAAQPRQDRVEFAAMFDADFVAEFHDPLMTGAVGTVLFDKATFMDLILHPDMTSEGAGSTMELIAVRGDDLCLYRVGMISSTGDLTERLIVDATHDGRCRRMDIFDPDQLDEALAVIDRWYRHACGIGDDHWMTTHWRVIYSADVSEMQPVLHPHFEFVERRPIAWPNGDADDLREWIVRDNAPLQVMIRGLYRLGEHGVVSLRSERFDPGDLGVIELVLVNEVENGSVRRVIAYGGEDLDQALSEFDEFVARREAGAQYSNSAWAIAQKALLAHRDGDRDRFASLLTDDFVGTAHDPIMASVDAEGSAFDRALFVEASFDPVLYGPGSTGDVELIAVRGDDLCAFRIRTDTAAGDVNERIHLIEVRDGFGVRWDSYRDDQLRQALIALDRRWLASLGFDDEDWIVRHWGLVYDIAFDDFRDILDDDFEFVDHRPLHFPSGDAAALSTTMNSLSHDVEVLIPQIHRISPSGGVFERIERAVGEVIGEEHMIVVSHIVDGTLRRLETYEVDDLATALARYDELTAAPVPAPSVADLTNRAWEIAAAFTRAYPAGDRDALDRMIDPDGVVEFRGHLNAFEAVSGREFLDSRLAVRPSADEGPRDIELVAVRGEHLCLVLVDRWLHGDRVRVPIVVESDDERITHMVWYDGNQLVAAQLELDRRWFESIGYTGRWWEPIRFVLYDPHPDAMFEHLAPDFEYVDHRPLMFPSGDAELLRSTIHSLQHDVVFTIPRFHRVSDAGSVIERLETAVGDVGQTHVVFVSQFVDERVQRMEAFDITQLDQALARYEEFVAGSGTHPDQTAG